MPMGPGKYDDLAMQAMKESSVQGVVLVVFDGEKGTGMSLVTLNPEHMFIIPETLRKVAQQIEESISRA